MSDDFQGDAPSDANQTATVTPPPQPTPAPQPDPGPKPFDPAAFFDDQHAQIAGARKALLASSMAGAVETEPERQSKIIAIADKLGVPSQAVASNYDTFARQIALTDSDYARTLVHHPDVASWLQIPDNAKLAHDDVPQLGELDRSFKKLAGQDVTGFLPEGYRFLPDGTIRGPLHVDGTPPAIYKSLSALRDRLQIEEGQEAVAEAPIKAAQERLNQGNFPSLESGLESAVASTLRFFAIGSGGVEPVTGITADQAKQMATVASIASERINPGLSGTAARAIGSLIGDAPLYLLGGEFAAASDMAKSLSIVRRAAQTLPEVPASAYMADVWKTALAYSPIGVRSGVNTGSDNGVAYGSLDFLINTLGPASIGSKIGLANAIIPGAETAAAAGGWGGFAARLTKHIGAQGGVMTATELANALHEYASGVNPDALKPENLVPRLAQAGAMGAAMAGAFHIPGALSEQIGRQQVAARAAMLHADNLGAAIEAAKATKADRSPERYGDLMRQSMPEEARTVYYQGDDFEEVAKAAQMTPADLASKLGVEDEYKLALATGKTMSVPTDKLVEFARGLEDDTAIQAIIRRQRQDPNGTNAEEALEFYKDAPDEIAKQAESFQAEVKKAAGSVSESDPIFNDFMAQAADSGRPLDEARQDARLMAAFYNVGAERFNAGKADGEPRMDPWEEYQKARLRVTGERAPEVEPLDAMLRRLRKGDIPKEEWTTPLSDYLRKQGFPEDITEENTDDAAEQAHAKGFIAENTRDALFAELEAEQGRPPTRDSQIRAALLDLKATLERHGIDLAKSDADIKSALGKGEGEAVKRFEQRLEVPSDYLKHEYLLKQWKKAHGDRTPTPGDKDWQKLREQADMVDEAQGRKFFQPAFHGTGNPEPYKRFSRAKVGGKGGEGAQAYGWGLYFAGKKEIAQFYREKLGGRKFTIDGSPAKTHEETQAAALIHNMGFEAASELSAAEATGIDAADVDRLKGKKIEASAGGRLYHVEIPDDHEMLDYDRTLADQPPAVIKHLRELVAAMPEEKPEDQPQTGRQWFEHLLNDRSNVVTGADFYYKLSKALAYRSGYMGDAHDRMASLALARFHIPGMRFLDAASRSGDGGTHNYVIFDDGRINITKYEQPGGNGHRGSLSFNAERHFVMTLTGKANLSTVLHESGHFWLEQMGEWSERADAPQALKDDYAKILGFLGVEKRADIETEHHEKFARAIEQYLMEGKSPSPELRGAFARFAIWLTALYKQVKSLVNLTPEVRGVFDRLFATDRAIEEARKDLGTSTIFKDQATSGMNDVQWKAYLNAIQRDRESQFANVYSRAMATLRRENTRTYKRELAQATADATAIIDARPVSKAMRAMVDGVDAEGKPLANPPKLDRADVEREFGKGNVHMLPRGITVDEGGWTLDRAAAEFGFRSGADLWTALAQKPDRAKDIKALADAIIKGRHPEMTADGMHDAAMDAVHANSAHADVLSRESAALAIKAQRRPIPQAHLFRMAEGIIARQNHRDVKSSAYIRAEKKANDESADALLKPEPDYTAAFLAKQRAELAHACYRAAMEAEAIIEKTHALMKDVKREKTLGMLGKAGGFVVSSPESSAAYPSEQEAQAAIDEMTERGVQGVTLATYQQRMNQLRAFWEDPDHRNDMDYGAVHDFYTEARSILHQARDAFTVMQEGEKAKLAEVISKGIQTQLATTGGKRVVVPRSKTKLYYIQKGLRDFDAFNRTLAAVARQMDGDKPNGWHFNTLVRPLNDAQNREVELRREYGQKMRDLMDAYGKRGELSKRLFIPAINDHLSLESRLAIMLNSGSTRNLDRLMNGPDQYTREQINAINHTLDEKDIALVKGIWALHNSFWPHIAAMEMKIHGIEPEKRDAIPVSTKFGTIDGAYYPIMYDADTSARAFQFSLEKAPNPLMGSPSKGFTKKTMETTGMRLRHDLMAAFQHNDQVAHYLAHAETIHNLNKILNNPDLKASIIDHFGIETYRLISERVKTVAEGARGPQSPIEKGLAFIRKRTGLAAVAFNVSTFVAHGFGIPQSMYRVGAGRYLSAMLRMTASAGQADSFFKMAAEKSSLMRNLHSALTPERYETMDNGSGGRIHQWFLDHAHDLIHLALKPINTATWVAEYERHIDEGKLEADAVALADQAVRDTQGTGQTIDMTKAQDLNELSRLMMQFSIFFTRTYQLGRQAVVDAFVKRDPASIMALLKATTMLVTIPTLTQALFHQAVKPDPSDDNSPGWWLSKLGRDHLEYLLSTFIGGRELSSLVEGYDYQGPAGMRSFSTVGTLVKELKGLWGDHPNLPGLGRTGLNLGLSLAGLPANQLDKILRGFIYDQDEGSASPLPLLFGPPPAHR